jgi:hypothetical protein
MIHTGSETDIQGRKITMKTIAFAAAVIAATVAVSAAATPAFAQPEVGASSVKVHYQENTGRYCIRQDRAGSLVPSIACRSKTDWAQQGVTISHQAPVRLAQR